MKTFDRLFIEWWACQEDWLVKLTGMLIVTYLTAIISLLITWSTLLLLSYLMTYAR